jgi:pyridoxine kinase
MERLKRIAALNDISGLGKSSLTVALPVISATGVECACLPTALLSTHTGEFEGFTFKDLSGELLGIARHWAATGAEFDGIYSGYLANPDQAALVEEVISILRTEDTLVFVDPAMADNGEYYTNLDSKMCAAFRKLCAKADIITPNITEAALLADLPYNSGPHSEEYVSQLFDKLGEICTGIIAITGVRPDEHRVGVAAKDVRSGAICGAFGEHFGGNFYGAGDIFASSFAALTLRGAALFEALETATGLVSDSIRRTLLRGTPRRFGLDFEGALPDYIARVERVTK